MGQQEATAAGRLTVAKVRFGEAISVRRVIAESLDVAAGDDLHLLLQYQFQDVSANKDEWRVTLRASLDGSAPKEAAARHGETPFVADEGWGSLRLTLPALAAGDHEVVVRVVAQHTEARWLSGKVEAQNEEVADYTVAVHAVAASPPNA